MKKTLKAAIGLLVISLTFSSCELFLLGAALNELAKDGQGSVDDPVQLIQGDNNLYVGYDGAGRNSYYKFTVPAGSEAVTITYSSTSNADLDYYLYTSESFNSPEFYSIASGTPSTWFDEYAVMGGSSYYLKVYNHTNSGTVNFTLALGYCYSSSGTERDLYTIDSSDYQDRSNWTYGNLDAGETHWYQLNVDYASSSVYIHWQDFYDYDDFYNRPSADIKVSVYAADKVTRIVPESGATSSTQDHGYNSDYTQFDETDGIGVYDATTYWVKVEGYSTSSYGYYYLSAVEAPVD